MDIEPDVSDVIQRSLASLVAAWDSTEELAQTHTGNAIEAVLDAFPIEVARLVASAKKSAPVEALQAHIDLGMKNWNRVCDALGRANNTPADEVLRGIEGLKNQAGKSERWQARAEALRDDWNRVCLAIEAPKNRSLSDVLDKIQELTAQRKQVLCEAPYSRTPALFCGRSANHGPELDHMAITPTGHTVRWTHAA